jgi:hypothetical protein
VNETGFDPRRDLEEIVFAAPGGRGDTRKLILARGAFDPPRLLGRAISSGARLTTYNGVDIAVRRQFMAFAFLDSTTAVIGDIDTVRGAIDRRQGGPGLSPDLTTRIDALSAAQDAWFVSQVPLSELAGQLPETTAGGALKGDALKAVEGASGGLKFGEALDVSAEIVARTPQDAAALADVVRFLASLLQTQRRPGTEQIGPVLNSLDIKTAGNLLTIGLMIPEELIESNFHVSPPAGR